MFFATAEKDVGLRQEPSQYTKKFNNKGMNVINKYLSSDITKKLLVLIITFGLFGCATMTTPRFVELKTSGVEIIANDKSFRISPTKHFSPNDFSLVCDSSSRGAGFKNGLPFARQLDVGIKNNAIPVTIKFDDNDSLQGMLLFCKVDTNDKTKTSYSINISKCKANKARKGKLVADYELSKISRTNHFSAAWILWMAKEKNQLLPLSQNKNEENLLDFSKININDPLSKIKKELDLCEDPRPISWLIPLGPSTAYYFDDQGVYLFFDKKENVKSIKFFEGYTGTSKSIRIGDSLEKIIKIHGEPHREIRGSRISDTGKKWMYGSGAPKVIRGSDSHEKFLMGYLYYEGDYFYRFDINPQTNKVQEMYSGKTTKPSFLNRKKHGYYGKISSLPSDGQNLINRNKKETVVSVKNNTVTLALVDNEYLFISLSNKTSESISFSLDDISATRHVEAENVQETLKIFSYEEFLEEEEERLEFEKRTIALKNSMTRLPSKKDKKTLNKLKANNTLLMLMMLKKHIVLPGKLTGGIVKVRLPEATIEQKKIIFSLNFGGEKHEFVFSQKK